MTAHRRAGDDEVNFKLVGHSDIRVSCVTRKLFVGVEGGKPCDVGHADKRKRPGGLDSTRACRFRLKPRVMARREESLAVVVVSIGHPDRIVGGDFMVTLCSARHNYESIGVCRTKDGWVTKQ